MREHPSDGSTHDDHEIITAGSLSLSAIDPTETATAVPPTESPSHAAHSHFGSAAVEVGATLDATPAQRRESLIQARFQDMGGEPTWGEPVEQNEGSYR